MQVGGTPFQFDFVWDAKAKNSARFSSRYFLLIVGVTNTVEHTSKNAKLLMRQETYAYDAWRTPYFDVCV